MIRAHANLIRKALKNINIYEVGFFLSSLMESARGANLENVKTFDEESPAVGLWFLEIYLLDALT